MIGSFLSKHLFSRNKFFIGGNWKSNNTISQSVSLVANTLNNMKVDSNKVDVVIAPINLHIHDVQKVLSNKAVKIAAQNCSNYNMGAYTGQVSSKHLKDIGLQWVILGHSQRRTIIKQNDELIVSKTKLAIQNGVNVIYCFGQTLQQRKSQKTWDVLDAQLSPLLAAYQGKDPVWTNNIVLAYEPVWAIGTGISSSPQQTRQVFDWLRTRLAKHISDSQKVRIIYGGSANAKNTKDYLSITSVDGLLVGGASLKPQFAEMVDYCNNA